MGKKIIIVFFSICIVALGVFLFLYFSKSETKNEKTALDAIPMTAAMIFEIKDYSNFINVKKDNQIWNQLKKVELFAKLDAQLASVDSVISAQGVIPIFENKTVYISLHLLGNKTYEPLFITRVEGASEMVKIQEFISIVFSKNALLTSRNYNDATIYDIVFNGDSKNTLHITLNDNLLIVGVSPVIVETAVRQMQSDVSLLTNASFSKVQHTAGKNVDVNVYVNYATLPIFTSVLVADNLKNAFKSNRDLASWAELDLNFKTNYILLNGFIGVNDAHDYLQLFIDQKPVDFDIYEFLPANTSMFWSFGLNDPKKFLKDYRTYLSQNEQLEHYKRQLDTLQTKFDADMVQTFADVCENEMALVFTEINSLDIDENTYVVMLTKSQSLAQEKFLGLLDSYATRAKIDFNSMVYEYALDEETKFKIYRMPEKGVPQTVFGNVFSYCEANYFTFYDNYLIFGNSIKSLTQYIHPLMLKKTLANDSKFKDFADNLSGEYNFYFYTNVSKAYDLLPEFLANNIKSNVAVNGEVYKSFDAVGYQFQSTNGTLYSNLYISYNPQNEDKPRTVWESFLDAPAASKPRLVEVHNSDEKNILVQDASNVLYMINKAGRILWKKQLDEKINSELFPIDFYCNGKMQYAFSTKTKLHIIDRIGNYVEHFPINLTSPTSVGMSLFDYENNRKYRIAIPCDDKRIMLYDQSGKVLKDWAFGKTDNAVTYPLQHFRINKSDYLIVGDKHNTYIVDRKGNKKITVAEKFEKSQQNGYFHTLVDGKDAFVTTDINGNVKQIFLDGTVKTVLLKSFSDKHFFVLQDVDGDTEDDYVIVDNDELSVFNKQTNKLFDYEFENDITTAPILYVFGSKNIKIGVVDNAINKIYLINNNGSLYEGFPLLGTTPFTIGHFNTASSRFNLLVGGDENFLYNYEVK